MDLEDSDARYAPVRGGIEEDLLQGGFDKEPGGGFGKEPAHGGFGKEPARGGFPPEPNRGFSPTREAPPRGGGGGGGASAYMLALPRWKQGMYAAVAFLLFITFVMTCASLGDADALELRVDALEADLAGTKSQLRASLGSNYDCSNTFGVLPNGAQSSKVVESPWGHAYQVVVSPLHVTTDLTSGLNYYDAVFDSAKRCHDGRRGYLATITSQKEQAFINDLLPETAKLNKYFYNVWLGGQDTKTEGEWRWANGPELGVGFWHGFAKDQGGSSWAGAFQNWYCYQDSSWPYCQPNNGGNAGNQDCLSMYGDGTWNDLDCGLRTQAYVVEYGNDVL